MQSARYVDGAAVVVERPAGAVHLRITLLNERCVPSGRIRRIFPLSLPNRFLSIQDRKGEEVAVIGNVLTMDPESRQTVEEHLDRTYFTPSILEIHFLRQEAGMWHFEVRTQRGPTSFYVRNWRDSAHEIAPGRWQIGSVDGARFEITELDTLDARSRKLLDQLL